jgi:hypothetical protein
MSWDVMILNAEGTPRCTAEMPADWRPKTMGETETVRAMIDRALPEVDWTDPRWGCLRGDGCSIEFQFQISGDVEAFTLHVRGGGDPVSAIVHLCKCNGWVALDYSTGELIDLDAPSRESWTRFQAYAIKFSAAIQNERPASIQSV